MANPSGPYEQVLEGEWYEVTLKDHRIMCCDCSKIHRVEFKVVPKGRGWGVQTRCWNDDKATQRARARAGIKVVRQH